MAAKKRTDNKGRVLRTGENGSGAGKDANRVKYTAIWYQTGWQLCFWVKKVQKRYKIQGS